MGCDIHLYKEKQINGQWLSADEWEEFDYGDDEKGADVPFKKRFTDRNYNLFGLLSKEVRCEFDYSFAPRGFPSVASPEVTALYDDNYDHSHSYLYLHELREIREFLNTQMASISGMKERADLQALHDSIASGAPNYDLLYPYCKWGSSPDLVEFTVDIPASYIIGECLDKIIASFDGVDGDNQRIVFWFDN